MASGSYARKPLPQSAIEVTTRIPARATRQLPIEAVGEEEPETGVALMRPTSSKALRPAFSSQPVSATTAALRVRPVVDEFRPHPLEHHKVWLRPLTICSICAIIILLVLISAGIFQRPAAPLLLNYPGGKVYDVQVGGSLASSWQVDQPVKAKTTIPAQTGPYGVLGKPTITADFINRVLAAYHSPAQGKGQALYDMGVKYNIDPAFALAFFQHESTFGTRGEATASLSLGNLRCIPNYRCQDNYAWFNTWEDGFKAWYELIRNLYIAQWGLVTVDQIIPKYAPAADHNDEAAYIASLKHSLDTWHIGQLMP